MKRLILSDEERKQRRRESAARYREANREKCREASQRSQEKRAEYYAEQKAKWKADNPEKVKAAAKALYEAKKDELNAATRKWQAENKDRFDAYQRDYRERNRGREKERSRVWKLVNRERDQIRKREYDKSHNIERVVREQNRRSLKRSVGGKLSKGLAERLMSAQRGKCACCKCDLKDSGFHLDHIMPLVLGGPNEDRNIQLLCPTCNLTKHAKHPVEFMQQRGFLL